MPYQFDIPLRPAANIEAPSATAAVSATKQEVIPKLAQLVIGQQLRGEILSRLQDGSYAVRVAGITAKMLLPEGSKIGDAIPLRLISTDPRPTFLMDNSGRSEATATPAFRPYLSQEFSENQALDHAAAQITEEAAGAGPNQQTPANDLAGTQQNRADTIAAAKLAAAAAISNIPMPTTMTAADELNSAPTVLSDTGKLIDQILHTGQPSDIATPTISKTPILPSAAALRDPVVLAKELQTGLTASGLFYESHIVEWADGKRPLTELLTEPQAQAGNLSDSMTSALTTNKELAQLIHQQLDTLEQQRIVWQGNLFPGQALEWEIAKQRSSHDTDVANDEQNWLSTVRFELPHLGQVSAVLELQANKLSLRLRAEQPGTVSALKTHAAELASALESSGSQLQSLTVSQDEQR